MAGVERDAALYNGFNLIVGEVGALLYFSNRDGRTRALGPGVYGLSNHLLDSPWPKVTAGKSGLATLLAGGGALIPSLFRLLSDPQQAADAMLPETGVSPEWERLLSAAFIASEGYGTRSSTVVLVGRDGGVRFEERSFGAGGAPEHEVRHEFIIETAVA
jgi:uncharacterized protein with NRDE domain